MANIITFAPSVPAKPEIDYPESDGQPMGETDFHIDAILYLLQALRHFFRQAGQIYMAADLLCFIMKKGTWRLTRCRMFLW